MKFLGSFLYAKFQFFTLFKIKMKNEKNNLLERNPTAAKDRSKLFKILNIQMWAKQEKKYLLYITRGFGGGGNKAA